MVAISGHAIAPLPDPSDSGESGAPRPAASISEANDHAGGAFRLEAISPRDPKLAAYIAHMSIEMAAMSRAAGFDLLAYFLDMARIEANIQSGKDG